MANDTIVTLSSIQEFDKNKDWLSRQVALDSSNESEGNQTLRELAGTIKVGVPSSLCSSPQKQRNPSDRTKRGSFRIHENSGPVLVQQRDQKRPSIRITVVPDSNLSTLAPPRRQSMRVSLSNASPTPILIEITPVASQKRPSFRLVEH